MTFCPGKGIWNKFNIYPVLPYAALQIWFVVVSLHFYPLSKFWWEIFSDRPFFRFTRISANLSFYFLFFIFLLFKLLHSTLGKLRSWDALTQKNFPINSGCKIKYRNCITWSVRYQQRLDKHLIDKLLGKVKSQPETN